MRQVSVAILLALLLAAFSFAGAQEDGDDTGDCAALVDAALEAAGKACEALDAGTACYGHPAAGADPHSRAELTFEAPGDRAAVDDISGLQAGPLDLEANEWGIAVAKMRGATALLLGDAALSDMDETGFDFRAMPGVPACAQASNALVLQTPEDATVTLDINGMRVGAGATLVLTLVDEETVSVRALAVTLVEGEAKIAFAPSEDAPPDLTLRVPGETAAITLNREGRVDGDSKIIPLPTDAIDAFAAHACANGVQSGLIREIDCGLEDVSAQQEDADTRSPEAICTISPSRSINRRSGPGTNYDIMGALDAGEEAQVTGQAEGADGFIWWKLADVSWVREDVVIVVAGTCADAPTAQAPPPPTSDMSLPQTPVGLPTPCGPEEGLRPIVNFSVNACAITSEGGPITSGERVLLNFELGRWSTETEAAAALKGLTGRISVDGVALRTQLTGVQPMRSGYSASLVAEWGAESGTHQIHAAASNGASAGCMVGVR